MSWADQLSKCSKAVSAAIGVGVMYGTLLLDHSAVLPSKIVVPLGALIAFATVFQTWLVRNEPLLEEGATAFEDLVHEFEDEWHRYHPAPDPVPPVDPAPVPDPVPVPAPAPDPVPVDPTPAPDPAPNVDPAPAPPTQFLPPAPRPRPNHSYATPPPPPVHPSDLPTTAWSLGGRHAEER